MRGSAAIHWFGRQNYELSDRCFVAYVSRHGHAFIDRALYLPKGWTDDPARLKATYVPGDIGFSTKPQLAAEMIERALAVGAFEIGQFEVAPVVQSRSFGSGTGRQTPPVRSSLAVLWFRHRPTDAASQIVAASLRSPRRCRQPVACRSAGLRPIASMGSAIVLPSSSSIQTSRRPLFCWSSYHTFRRPFYRNEWY
jgi:hypothetical protein